ncbi:Phosphoglucomutase [Geobacillus sp. WSUCF1]|nr:Phosphoglucomutase [Geobacillus sp. WSUCF1]
MFKEYDIRGRAGEELDESFAYWLGRAFADMMQKEGEKRAVVGHDNRLSSPGLHRALKDGLLDGGCDVVDIGFRRRRCFTTAYTTRIFHAA